MNITKVVIQPLAGFPGGRLIAFVNLIVEGKYAVNGLRIVRNQDGTLDVLYPSLHAPNRWTSDKRTPYAFVPMNSEAHCKIRDLVLCVYRENWEKTVEFDLPSKRKESIERAKARGATFGRPKMPKPEAFAALNAKWQRKEISSRQAAKELGISQDTFLRWAHEVQESPADNENEKIGNISGFQKGDAENG